MGFHVLVTVSSVGSCDFDRLNSFLLVLCAAVEHGITVTRLLLESTDLLHSTVAMLTLQSLQQCTGVLPPLSSRVFYNQKKKMVFLPIYRRSLTSFTQFHLEASMPYLFFLFPKLSKVNSVKEKHHLTKSAFIFFHQEKYFFC